MSRVRKLKRFEVSEAVVGLPKIGSQFYGTSIGLNAAIVITEWFQDMSEANVRPSIRHRDSTACW